MSELREPSAAPTAASSAARAVCGVIAALAVAHVLARVAGPVLATDALHDDYRQNWFWLGQVHAGVDFSATDPLTAYARAFQPPALAWLYEGLARALDPYLFTKWIGLALLVPFAAALGWLGERSSPRGVVAPLLVAAGLLDDVWLRELMGGLARSYGPIAQVALVATVVAGRWWLAVACLALAGLVHPQSLLLGASLFAVGAARAWRARRTGSPEGGAPSARPAPLAPIAAAAAVTIVLAGLNAWHARGLEARFGAFLPRTAILDSVDYGPGGRFRNERPALLPVELARTVAAHAGVPAEVLVRVPPFAPLAVQLPWALGVLAAVSAGVEALRRASGARWRDVPWWIPACLGVAALWNVVAYLLLPRLYFPRRFLVSYAPLALFGSAAWLADVWLRSLDAGGKTRTRALLAVALVGLAVASFARFDGGPLGYRVARGGYEGVARFLGSQPVATRYAASPRGDADTLVALVPRRIEVASELAHPLFADYLEKTVRRRTRTVTRALFPDEPARDVASLAADGVQLLVLRRRDLGWAELPPTFAYEPIRSEVTAYWDAAHRDAARAFWAERAPLAAVYEDESFLVVDLRKLGRG